MTENEFVSFRPKNSTSSYGDSFPHKDIVFEFANEYPDFISSVMTDDLYINSTIAIDEL